MMTDPYKVLGVSPSSSNDDIKKAYRDLSRKYHPDSYVDNPLSDLAEEKFKEVQEAYQQIMNEREHGDGTSSSNQSYGGGSYSGYGNGGSYGNNGSSSGDMVTVYNYLNAGRYRDALNILSGINNRNAQWYYYSAVANMGMGNNYVGLDHARQATALDPGNAEYRAFLNRIQNASMQYNNMGRGYGRSNNDDMCDTCMKLWCADSLCECMGGDLIPCI